MTPLLDVRGLRKHYTVLKRALFGRRQLRVVRAVEEHESLKGLKSKITKQSGN